MNLTLFSKALYSSWGLHTPTRTLFDCGEGCATALGNLIYQPERICIGHGHGDHVLGLPSFVGCRNSGRGDKGKPLVIYAPETREFAELRRFVMARNSRLHYPLAFETIHGGSTIPLDNKHYIECFDVKHAFNSLCFKVMEKRQRLKAGVRPEDAKARKMAGEVIHEEYGAPTFVWTLDSASYDLIHIQDAQHLVADATFLGANDRDDTTHASVEEVLDRCVTAKVQRVSLAHISTRYSWNEARDFIAKAVQKSGYQGVVDVVLGDKVYDL